MRLEKPPAVCPRCGSSRTVRVIWRCVHLCGEDEQNVKAGTAIIVDPQVAQSYEPWQPHMWRHAGALPLWGCLYCAPSWSDVHLMAVKDDQRQIDKEDAIAERHFDRAEELRDAQYRDRDSLVAAVARMLDEADPPGGVRVAAQSSGPGPPRRVEAVIHGIDLTSPPRAIATAMSPSTLFDRRGRWRNPHPTMA
jgi:hypothetical protein